MRRIFATLLVIVISNTVFADGRGAVDTSNSPHAKLRSVPMVDVRWKILQPVAAVTWPT